LQDRYANIGIAYLLQRMEECDGILELATNLKKNIDAGLLGASADGGRECLQQYARLLPVSGPGASDCSPNTPGDADSHSSRSEP
jgi:hypothetical protein